MNRTFQLTRLLMLGKINLVKPIIFAVILITGAALFTSCATRNRPSAIRTGDTYDTYDTYGTSATAADGLPVTPDDPVNDPWPMTFTDDGASYTVYEPQCDSWDGHEIAGRSAIAVVPAGALEPVYGVVAFRAITLVDKNSRTATLADFKLTRSDFPYARGQGQSYLPAVMIHFAKGAPPIPLDHLENNFVQTEAPKRERLNNTPPDVIIATQPAVLIYIDGPPAWRPVPGTELQRCLNTRMLVLKDAAGRVYVHLFDGYLQAPALNGPWTVATQPPGGAELALKQTQVTGQVDLMTGAPDANTQRMPSLQSGPVPVVYVATKPSELIQFNGAPTYAAIRGTDLLYANNTSGNVFKSVADQQNYILISGRWYRASSLNGPWKFVSGDQLPRDFANIPDDSPKENVKASVPGTQQAEEALIANSIPQSTAVPRTTQMPPPQLDGAPQLAPIAGTPLHYIVNSATPTIEVDPQSWYACQNGVWYAATSANGPWTVAASVPAVIYTIPPDSPLHYVTYVQVYGATPTEVYEGYTPGYFGTEICDDGTVVYGTGYYYDPWIGTVWYGPPVTWGSGFGECWTPWWGWGFNCGFGWGWGFGWGFYPPWPWWCGFRDWHDHDFDRDRDFDRFGRRDRHWANTGANVYRHDGQFAANRFTAAGLGANRGSFGHAYNSRTGLLAGGQRAAVPSVTGSAWNHGWQGRSSPNGFYRGENFGGVNRWNSSRSPNDFNSWPGTRQQWNYGRHPYFEPDYGGLNRASPNPYGGWRGGNNFFPPDRSAPNTGGFYHGNNSGGSHGIGGYHGGGDGGGYRGGGGGGRGNDKR